MIVIGYQGVGKSSLAQRIPKVVDLESSNFRIDGRKPDDWYKPYGNIALDLSRQGFIVMTASHAPVREWIGTQNSTNENVFICHPAIALKDEWIEKLQRRFDETGLTKDEYALQNAQERYEYNIGEMIDDATRFHWGIIELATMDYNLCDLLANAMHTNITNLMY